MAAVKLHRVMHLPRAAGRWLARAIMIACFSQPAQALQPLADGELATVVGRDGFYFNLVDFSLSGPLTLTYTSPAGASLALSNLALSRSDDPDHLFTDPYGLNIEAVPGQADMINLTLPQNLAGLQRWKFAADMQVDADGLSFANGAVMLDGLAFYGGGLQLTTPRATGLGDGVAFGLALRTELDALVLRPRGRADAGDEMRLAGVKLGGVNADGSWTNQPWVMADVVNQPGLVRAIVDDKGPAIQLAIDWSSAPTGAPLGGLAIDKISFANASGITTDLGSSRIATMQLQFVDIRLRPGP